MPKLGDDLDQETLERLRGLQHAARGPTLMAVRKRLGQLEDEVFEFVKSLGVLARKEDAEFRQHRARLVRKYNETTKFVMTHEDAHDHNWAEARKLRALRLRIRDVLGLLDKVHAKQEEVTEAMYERLSRAILPARKLPKTQDGPTSDNYYREPVDSK